MVSLGIAIGVALPGAAEEEAAPPPPPPAPVEIEALLAEVSALRTRVTELEARVALCEERGGGAPPAKGPRPHDPAEMDGEPPAAGAALPGRRLVFTGQTLAEKVQFLDDKCRKLVACAPLVLAQRSRMPAMSIDETRTFSSAVSRCAHRCSVEIALTEEIAAQPLPEAPDEDVGIRGPDERRGLQPYPGKDASPDELRSFLSVRCQDLACARLGLGPVTGGDGPAVQRFLSTCAEACATEKGLDVGQ